MSRFLLAEWWLGTIADSNYHGASFCQPGQCPAFYPGLADWGFVTPGRHDRNNPQNNDGKDDLMIVLNLARSAMSAKYRPC